MDLSFLDGIKWALLSWLKPANKPAKAAKKAGQ
jgi:hypothetical protein